MSESSQNLEGGRDAINPHKADWVDEEGQHRLRWAGRMNGTPVFPCPGCDWNNWHHRTSQYESSLRVIHTCETRAVWKISDAFVLKDEEAPHMIPGRCNEETTNEFLRKHTSLKVRGSGSTWTSENRLYNMMPWVPGHNLLEIILHRVSQPIKPVRVRDVYGEVMQSIKDMRQQLQSDRIVTADGGRCGGGYRLGIKGGLFPESREALLEYLKTKRKPDPSRSTEELEEFRNRCPKFEPLVFSHGDLTCANIIVHEGRLSAIIDWESAGYYPVWWEYYTMDPHLRPIAEDYIGCHEDAVTWMEQLDSYYPMGVQVVDISKVQLPSKPKKVKALCDSDSDSDE